MTPIEPRAEVKPTADMRPKADVNPPADANPQPDVAPADPTSTDPTSTDPTPAESRADRFVRDLAALKIPDPAAARAGLWLRLGGALMVLSLVLGVSAYLVAHNTQNPLDQRDGLALGLGGIAAGVVGGALFLRYSLTGFLRFWMARQSYDLAVLADRLCAASSEREPAP